MRMHGLKAIALAASLALAGGMAQAQEADAPAAPTATVQAAPTAVPPPAVTTAPAADQAVAAPTEKPVDPTLNADGSHKYGPVAGIGMPTDKAIGIQPQVTTLGASAANFHNYILLPVIIATSILVLLLIFWTILRYRAKANPVASKTSHNTLIEVIWTGVPVLILAAIAFPSLGLLAKQFAPAPENAVTIKATGSQWYWTHEYPEHGGISITSNMLKEKEEVQAGQRFRNDVDGPRLLAVDNRIVVPVGVPIRLQVTASDVIHSWAMPAFWTKIDAVPGRLNETRFTVDKAGIYFGQCSELCGARHAYMPIVIEAVAPEVFAQWIAAKGGTMPEVAKAKAAAEAAKAAEDAKAAKAAEAQAAAANTAAPAENASQEAALTNQAATGNTDR